MAIRVQCDNCERILRDSEQESGAEPEKAGTLKLSFGEKNLFVMDLCGRCTKKYLDKLKEPLE